MIRFDSFVEPFLYQNLMIYFDDLKRTVDIPTAPQRIVSLVPSVTELLFDLDLEDKLVGRTKFCIHPQTLVAKIPSVGGTKNFNLEQIRNLKPDLILAVKEENNKDLILEIAQEFPVMIFDVIDLPSAIQMMRKIGDITQTETKARQLITSIQTKVYELQKLRVTKKTACYLIWHQPQMTVGRRTFISEMMLLAGFINVFDSHNDNYPVITAQDINLKQPETILLSSEPFKFTAKHQEEYQKQFPNSEVILVDGEFFSWYGSRMLKALDYLMQDLKK